MIYVNKKTKYYECKSIFFYSSPLTHSAGPVKNGQTRIFWNVGAFPAVVVTGLGDASKWDVCDEINGTKENARIAAAAGTKALMGLKFDQVYLEDLGSAQSAAEGAGLSAFKFQELKAADKKVTFPTLSLAEGAVGPEDFQRGLILANAQNWARK
jgi:cytosol aminopeptidase